MAHYASDGSVVWAKNAGGTARDEAYAITSLSDNSTVVTGTFWGSATFGQGEPNQTTLDLIGSGDLFVVRYNSDGTLSWVKHAGGNEVYGNGIKALPDDSTVVIGRYNAATTFGQGEPNETVLDYIGSEDVFLARYYK